MHDNLRLQRLVQQLAHKVEEFTAGQAVASKATADTEKQHERHQEIMALTAAIFKEMSLQVFIALSPGMCYSYEGVANL